MSQSQNILSTITFPLIFKYELTKAGQEAALAQGVKAATVQTVKGVIPYATGKEIGLRLNSSGDGFNEPLIELRSDVIGHPIYSRDMIGSRFKTAKFDAPLSFEDALLYELTKVGERQRLREQKRAEAHAEIEAFLADETRSDNSVNTDYADKEMRAQYEHVRDARQRAFWEAEESRKAAEKAERERVEAALREAKRAQIAHWVAHFGTQNQQARFAANLFPESEAENAIKEQAFAPYADFARYQPLTAADVRATCSENCACNSEHSGYTCAVEYKVIDPNTVSADEWEQLQTIKNVIPGGGAEIVSVTLKRHYGECQDRDCDSEKSEGIVSRNGIYVKLRIGAFTFNREFAVQ